MVIGVPKDAVRNGERIKGVGGVTPVQPRPFVSSLRK